MSNPNKSKNKPLVILFSRKGKNYRMRVARVHVHPGERDCLEIRGETMLGDENWTPVPDGWQSMTDRSHLIPSPEWLIRRALWMAHEPDGGGEVNLGDI